MGIGFSAAVFLTYLLIGFGILSFIQHLSFLPLFSRIVYLITIAIALVLGSYSLYDYIQLKRGTAFGDEAPASGISEKKNPQDHKGRNQI